MYSATAYNHAYADTGLFCIHASSPPEYVRDMAEVIVKELVAMAGSISDQELRVKKTLTFFLLSSDCLSTNPELQYPHKDLNCPKKYFLGRVFENKGDFLCLKRSLY